MPHFRTGWAGSAALAGLLAIGLTLSARAQTTEPKPVTKAQLDRPVVLPETLPQIRADHKESRFSLTAHRAGKNLVLFFLNEQCGVTFYYKKRLQQLQNDFESRGFAFVGVRCGKKQHPDEPVDLPELGYLKMPFVEDEGGALADTFQISQSMTFAVIDRTGRLRYRGGVDDRVDAALVKKTPLRDALRALAAGKPVPVKEGRSLGCAILPVR